MPLPPPPSAPLNRYLSDENDGLLAGNYSASLPPLASRRGQRRRSVGRPPAPSRRRPIWAPSVLIGFGNQSVDFVAVVVNEVIIGMDSSSRHPSCCRDLPCQEIEWERR